MWNDKKTKVHNLSTPPPRGYATHTLLHDAVHVVGVEVRRHGFGQREAVGHALERCGVPDVEGWGALAQRHHLCSEPAATPARRGALASRGTPVWCLSTACTSLVQPDALRGRAWSTGHVISVGSVVVVESRATD